MLIRLTVPPNADSDPPHYIWIRTEDIESYAHKGVFTVWITTKSGSIFTVTETEEQIAALIGEPQWQLVPDWNPVLLAEILTAAKCRGDWMVVGTKPKETL